MPRNIEELKAKQAQELENAEIENKLELLLPGKPRIYAGLNLYGAKIHVTYKLQNLREVLQIAEALPSEGLYYTRGTFTAFKPKAYVESLSEELRDREHPKGELEICPFLVGFEPFNNEVRFVWYHRALGGELLQITCELPSYTPEITQSLGRVEVKYKTIMGGRIVERCEVHPAPNSHVVMSDSGEALAQLEHPIKWASGGQEYPNKFTCYYVNLGDTHTLVTSFIEHLIRVGQKVEAQV